MKINDNGTERDMTETEIVYHKEWQTSAENETKLRDKAASDKAAAREAVLDKLGLTADEATALFG